MSGRIDNLLILTVIDCQSLLLLLLLLIRIKALTLVVIHFTLTLKIRWFSLRQRERESLTWYCFSLLFIPDKNHGRLLSGHGSCSGRAVCGLLYLF